MVLSKNAVDKLDGEKDKQEHNYWINFKLDVNALPKLSKEKLVSLDMHA